MTGGRCGVAKTAGRFNICVNSNLTFNYFEFKSRNSKPVSLAISIAKLILTVLSTELR